MYRSYGLLLLGSMCAYAGLITTAPAGGTTTQFAGGTGCAGGTDAGFTITIVTNPVCWPNSESFGLTNNGFWNGFPLIGINTGAASFDIDLGGLYSAAGVFMNYNSPVVGTDPTITALDSLGDVIETADLATLAPISTPGGTNAGAFRGFSESTPAIRFLQFTGDFIAVDSITLVSTVPEPSTFMLIAFAGAALFALRQIRSRTQRAPLQ